MEQTCDLLIRDCSLLEKNFTVTASCSVAVTGTRISGIYQAGDPLPVARETLNGTGKLLMPGLVDGHTHCCQQLLRGSGQSSVGTGVGHDPHQKYRHGHKDLEFPGIKKIFQRVLPSCRDARALPQALA